MALTAIAYKIKEYRSLLEAVQTLLQPTELLELFFPSEKIAINFAGHGVTIIRTDKPREPNLFVAEVSIAEDDLSSLLAAKHSLDNVVFHLKKKWLKESIHPVSLNTQSEPSASQA